MSHPAICRRQPLTNLKVPVSIPFSLAQEPEVPMDVQIKQKGPFLPDNCMWMDVAFYH